ncbi:unnamed protein product, partial [Polarella glacialis]
AHTRPMKELSGGQKARVCFASITCRKPEILILDEPTNHLDIESVEALIDSLKRYEGGLMLVSHDARLIQAAGCELWVCKAAGELSVGRTPTTCWASLQASSSTEGKCLLTCTSARRWQRWRRPDGQRRERSAGPTPFQAGSGLPEAKTTATNNK